MIKDKSTLESRISILPKSPGIYIFSDELKQIIYIGKSNSLRDRISSYFRSNKNFSSKTIELVNKIEDFEFITTDTDQEAILLENSLIKKHRPKYNVRLKDDKNYPYIKVDFNDPFPKIYVSRKASDKNAKYFGPFASAFSVRKTLNLLNKLFPYRTCTKKITGKDPRPCLEFHIKRCIAPCTGYASQKEYKTVINEASLFLSGNTQKVMSKLKNEMKIASNNMKYEKAALIRDRIKSIENIYEKQQVMGVNFKNTDVINIAKNKNESWIEVFFIRNGNLLGRENFMMLETLKESTDTIIYKFIEQFYSQSSHIPKEIIIPEKLQKKAKLEVWLNEINNKKYNVKIIKPMIGKKLKILNLVKRNAEEGYSQYMIKHNAKVSEEKRTLAELQEDLNLISPPNRIECFDISHIQGTNTVGSMVVFENGKPKKSHYRKFKIKSHDKNDDFASMYEVLKRRCNYLVDPSNKESSFSQKPDLIIIDGGKGQLSKSFHALLQLGLGDIPIISLAKKEEEIFIPYQDNPLIIDRKSKPLFLLQRIRDESHRFAINFHRNLRSNNSNKSILDSIDGIGAAKRKFLLKHFGSVKKIRQAPDSEIALLKGFSKKLAKKIKENI